MELDEEEKKLWDECAAMSMKIFLQHAAQDMMQFGADAALDYAKDAYRAADAMIEARRKAMKKEDEA